MLSRIKSKQSGFTIVELLIVIVVIAILAAITIVAYNGIQSRAKTSSAQSAANTLMKKLEAYNTINSGYPTALVATTGFAVTNGSEPSLAGTGITIGTPASSASPSTVGYQPCTATGGKVTYYDYTAGAVSTAVNIGTPGTCGTALSGGPY